MKLKFFPPALLLLLAASCATRPPAFPPLEDILGDFDLLPPGGAVYCFVDVPAARPILDGLSIEGMHGRDFAEVLDRSSQAAAAFYPPGTERRFMAAARGDYPVSRINAALSLSAGWKKGKSETGPSYWRSAEGGLSLYVNSSRALVSGADPLTKPPGTPRPAGFEEMVFPPEGRRAALAGWVEDAAGPLNRFLASLQLPLQIPTEKLFFALYPAAQPETYEALIRLDTPSASLARGLVILFAITRFEVGNAAVLDPGGPLGVLAPLFANMPVQEEASLSLRSGPLKAGQIALLFETFSVNSKEI
jgi:hypothetical protein